MQNKENFAVVNTTLQDICGTESLFGDIPGVLGGDFAQTLPIIPQENRATQVNASICQSFLWPQFSVLKLRKNMRVRPDEANQLFAKWISDMSYHPRFYYTIELPPQIINRFHRVEELCEFVFPRADLHYSINNPDFFRSRAILTWRNDTVADLNQIFESINQADYDGGTGANTNAHELPTEFFQSINIASLPPSQLRLKIGTPVMLMRNLHDEDGLCNGTRLVVTRLHRYCIGARILGGKFDGQPRILFRASLTTNDGDFPFKLTRKQFPIRVCFAMTVNKSRGQSLDLVGVDLRTSSFSHRQLYVALSRVTDVSKLALLFKEDAPQKTENIVYSEVLLSN